MSPKLGYYYDPLYKLVPSFLPPSLPTSLPSFLLHTFLSVLGDSEYTLERICATSEKSINQEKAKAEEHQHGKSGESGFTGGHSAA